MIALTAASAFAVGVVYGVVSTLFILLVVGLIMAWREDG